MFHPSVLFGSAVCDYRVIILLQSEAKSRDRPGGFFIAKYIALASPTLHLFSQRLPVLLSILLQFVEFQRDRLLVYSGHFFWFLLHSQKGLPVFFYIRCYGFWRGNVPVWILTFFLSKRFETCTVYHIL